MLLLGIVGCHWIPPAVTTESGMGGVILDPAGAPVVGLKVENLESSVLTDADGRFGLHYKRPETYVTFVWRGMPFRRSYRAADEGLPVEVRLPDSREVDVDCGSRTCALTLDWELGEGLSARWDGRCEPDRPARVPGAPPGLPTVTCRPSVTEPPVPVGLRLDGARLAIGDPARRVEIELTGEDLPSDCAVSVGGEPAVASGDGRFALELSGSGWVNATCAGRSALPVRVESASTNAVIAWVATGPELRPDAALQHDRLRLEREGGWVLDAIAAPSGGFLLPPLAPGRYALQLHGGALAPVPAEIAVEAIPGRVVGSRLASGQYAGALVLEVELADGVLPVEDGG